MLVTYQYGFIDNNKAITAAINFAKDLCSYTLLMKCTFICNMDQNVSITYHKFYWLIGHSTCNNLPNCVLKINFKLPQRLMRKTFSSVWYFWFSNVNVAYTFTLLRTFYMLVMYYCNLLYNNNVLEKNVYKKNFFKLCQNTSKYILQLQCKFSKCVIKNTRKI